MRRLRMDKGTTFEQAADLEMSEAGEGFILYDEPRDRVHFLNATAAVIYELCRGGRSLAELAACLDEGFSLEASSQDEVATCLLGLEAEHLLRRLA